MLPVPNTAVTIVPTSLDEQFQKSSSWGQAIFTDAGLISERLSCPSCPLFLSAAASKWWLGSTIWTVLDVGLIQFSRFPVMILSFSRPVASTCNTPPSSLCKIETMCRNYQKSAYIDSFLKLQINVKCITCSRNPKVRCQLKPSASQYTSQLFSAQCSFVVHSPVQNGSTQFRSSWYLEARRCSLPDLGGVRRSSSRQFLFISHFVPLLTAYLFQWASATFSCSWVLNWESHPGPHHGVTNLRSTQSFQMEIKKVASLI